jgi:dienelactone hydrolase
MAATILAATVPAVQVSAQNNKNAREPREYMPPPFVELCERRVAELAKPDWLNAITRENWPEVQTKMRRELQSMLGLDPWPERTPLQPVVAGVVTGDGYLVERLQFQSRPGLYVGANLYRPTEISGPLPAILYVCGHSRVVENGVSMGNKTDYQHHGIWFARHGYVCLVIDTIELGEIPGFHHGTYNLGRWWWAARGYTPAGVEAWNGIRALDYLETRPEVDRTRLGVTGRSGGGAYSWWIAALDDRIKAAVPVAGITTLKNHVIDGAIEGHCDCMFMVNTFRWDFDRVAALVAPRPLLISNSDKDEIFPLDGVVQVYERARAVYRKLGREDQIGLHISEGPHKDTQPLYIGAFEWMNRFLKGTDRMAPIDEPALKRHSARELKVFAEIPADEIVTKIDETFVPAFRVPAIPADPAQWARQRNAWLQGLRTDCFRAWPHEASAPAVTETVIEARAGTRVTRCEFASEPAVNLQLWVLQNETGKRGADAKLVLRVLDGEVARALGNSAPTEVRDTLRKTGAGQALTAADDAILNGGGAVVLFTPRRAVEANGAPLSERKTTQLRRRLHLLGESLESEQVWDICQALRTALELPRAKGLPLEVQARGTMAANALYASLFVTGVARLDLAEMPASHRDAPIYLNVLRHLDLPQALALAAERCEVKLTTQNPALWNYATQVARALQWAPEKLRIGEKPATAAGDVDAP